MARLSWQNSFSVNINSIDTQHKKLFEVINEFYNSLKEKKNSDALMSILMELKKSTDLKVNFWRLEQNANFAA